MVSVWFLSSVFSVHNHIDSQMIIDCRGFGSNPRLCCGRHSSSAHGSAVGKNRLQNNLAFCSYKTKNLQMNLCAKICTFFLIKLHEKSTTELLRHLPPFFALKVYCKIISFYCKQIFMVISYGKYIMVISLTVCPHSGSGKYFGVITAKVGRRLVSNYLATTFLPLTARRDVSLQMLQKGWCFFAPNLCCRTIMQIFALFSRIYFSQFCSWFQKSMCRMVQLISVINSYSNFQ